MTTTTEPTTATEQRLWFCSLCKDQVKGGTAVPTGWFQLRRYVGRDGDPPARLGLFCSATCLALAARRLADREA